LISALLERNEAFEVAVEILEQKGARGVPQIILLLGKLSYEYVRRFSEFERYPIAESLLYRAFDAALVEWSVADHETRAIIVDTMFRLTGDRAVECMSEIAAEPDPWLRVHIIELMGEIRDRRAIDVVVTFLEDEDEMVREAALSLLQSRGFQPESTEYAEFS
jgi:HEAT repeat protein